MWPCALSGVGSLPTVLARLSEMKERLLYLESLRGCAAIAVALFHFTNSSVLTQNRFVQNVETMVDFFFVLSGFVIAYSCFDRIVDWSSLVDFQVSGNFENHERLRLPRRLVDDEIDARLKQPTEPVLNFLVPLLCLTRPERSADGSMGLVLYAPHEVGRGLSVEGGGIREGGNIFPNLLWLRVVELELDPFSFAPQGR